MAGNDMKMIIEMKEDIASIKSILNTMANTNTTAIEALQSTRSAHFRLDEMKKEINDMRSAQRWLIGTTISVAGLFIAAVGFLWKLGGL